MYRRAASNSARELAESLAVNARKLSDLGRAHFGQGVRAGDTVICWGESLQPINGVRILNGGVARNKLEDANVLRAAGVPTIEVSATQPAPPAPQEFNLDRYRGLNALDRTLADRMHRELAAFLARPATQLQTWLARRFNHVGGSDLLHPPQAADYYSKKEALIEEFRIHCFKGLSIRAGKKVPRDGAQPHEWIRSLDGGWRINYDGFHSKESMRVLAARAIEALGLDFGAVDIGRKADKSLIVLEVNRAPGLSDNSAGVYANAIQNWVNAR